MVIGGDEVVRRAVRANDADPADGRVQPELAAELAEQLDQRADQRAGAATVAYTERSARSLMSFGATLTMSENRGNGVCASRS